MQQLNQARELATNLGIDTTDMIPDESTYLYASPSIYNGRSDGKKVLYFRASEFLYDMCSKTDDSSRRFCCCGSDCPVVLPQVTDLMQTAQDISVGTLPYISDEKDLSTVEFAAFNKEAVSNCPSMKYGLSSFSTRKQVWKLTGDLPQSGVISIDICRKGEYWFSSLVILSCMSKENCDCYEDSSVSCEILKDANGDAILGVPLAPGRTIYVVATQGTSFSNPGKYKIFAYQPRCDVTIPSINIQKKPEYFCGTREPVSVVTVAVISCLYVYGELLTGGKSGSRYYFLCHLLH